MGRSTLAIFSMVAMSAMLFQCKDAEAGRGSRNVARGGEFSFQLESNGRSLPTYNHRGYTYVEGLRGQRYTIRVFNHSPDRVEALVTVDGRDVITGRPGNCRNQRGYVIEGYGSVAIDGFRKSWSGVAAFRFTEIEDSYAARMGNATNVGVIGVAVFKEKKYRPRPKPPVYSRKKLGTGYGYGGAAQPAPESSAGAPCCDDMDSVAKEKSRRGIGTGYGEETYSPATETRFTRRNSRRPDARMAIYYDDREGLIARGVLPRPRPRPRPYYQRPVDPQPFPSSHDNGFAPPPPPRYCWE